MASHPELDPIVARLNESGVPAMVDSVRQHHMEMVGIRTGDDFFPLWELSAGGNKTDVATLNLAGVKARRHSGWTPFGYRSEDSV